jgi:hypothetical protein
MMKIRQARYALLSFVVCWLLSACGTQPTPPAIGNQVPQSSITPARAATPQIVSFIVSPNPVERGEDLTISWQVDGAAQATLWQLTYDSRLARWDRQPDPVSSGSNIGEYRLTVPGDANRTLRFELEAKNSAGNSVTATSDEIQLVCHALFFKAAMLPWCPNAPETTSAAFQAFEGGYMISRADTGQVYVLRQATSDLPPDWFAFFPTNDATNRPMPTAGILPGEHFQRAWANLPDHWQSLGAAIAPEQTYTLTTQLSLSRGDTLNQNDDLYLTFPTGAIAHLLIYLSAPNHASGPAWSYPGSDQSAQTAITPTVDQSVQAQTAADLITDPALLTLPAGTSGRVLVHMNHCDQKLATFEASAPPPGLKTELLNTATPCDEVLLLHPDVSLPPGEYLVGITRRSSTGQTATSEVALHVIECTELQAGEFTTAIQSNLITVISAGKPSIEHGLLVPLQFCGNRQVVVDLLAATSETGTPLTSPPRFYLYRSWVWPAPNAIQANAAVPWTLNVAVPRIDSGGWQLTAHVPAGMYLLVFERDAFGSSTDPRDIPAAVTYRVSEEVP